MKKLLAMLLALVMVLSFAACSNDEPAADGEGDGEGETATGSVYWLNFKPESDEALKENCCDMHETIYHYAVVEEIEAGIHGLALRRWFYKYDKERCGFYPIDEPAEFEGYINIALG